MSENTDWLLLQNVDGILNFDNLKSMRETKRRKIKIQSSKRI